MNPLLSIRETCDRVVAQCQYVHIDEASIEKHAAQIGENPIGDFYKDVEWDAQGWHYCADVAISGPLTVQYIFVMDALNFCFWPSPRFEYDTLAMSLKAVLEADETALNADKLATISEVRSVHQRM
jgi:hypothetical protein